MKRIKTNIDDTIVLVTAPRKHRVVVQNIEGRSFSRGDDEVFFSIDFDPPLQPKEAKKSKIQITHQSKTRQCIDGVHIRVAASGGKATKRTLGKRKYSVYETHALEVDKKKQVKRVYIKAEDNQLRYKSNDIVLQPSVDMGHVFLSNLFGKRYTGLEFFPPDVTVMGELGSIQPSEVPQKTPLWFKLRGEVSGSKAYTLLGFYVPEPGSKEAVGWSIDGKKEFNRWSKLNMRFGTLHEDHMIIAYLLAPGHEDRRFFEVGWCQAPQDQGYPPTWGASPDGLLENPHMTWEDLPTDISKYYKKADWNVTRGVAEFKASRSNCKMQPYYYPQLYMEMISTRTLWADLVRYSETREMNPDGSWCVVRTCRVFRVYRHKPTEDLIVSLLKQSLANKKNLIDLVQTEPYMNIRSYFYKLAQSAEETCCRQLDVSDSSVIGKQICAYEEYKKNAVAGYLNEPDAPDEDDAVEQVWDEIEKNNMDMYRLYEQHKVEEFCKLYSNQVHMYTQLMDNMWDGNSE